MNFLSISPKYSSLESSKVVVLPIPYEMTTSYMSGCSSGPSAIIAASAHVELFDEQLGFKPHTVGVHTAPSIENFTSNHDANLDLIGSTYLEYFNQGKFVIGFGGEHSITIGIIKYLSSVVDFSVVHFDAHADLRNYYQGSYNSHACAIRRSLDYAANVYSIGVRSLSEPEYNYINSRKASNRVKIVHANDVIQGSALDIVQDLSDFVGDNVFITFDVDYFSSNIVSDTGTPEPGGPEWFQTMNILSGIFREKNVLGADIVELIGNPDSYSSFNTALLARKLIGLKFSTEISGN